MKNEEIEFFEKLGQGLMRIVNECQSIPSLSYACSEMLTVIGNRVQGQRDKNLKDLQEGNGPVATRIREEGRIRELLRRSENGYAADTLAQKFLGEELFEFLGAARYSDCVNPQALNDLVSKYMSVKTYDSILLHRKAFDVNSTLFVNLGFILPTVYEASHGQLTRSIATFDCKVNSNTLNMTIRFLEKNGSYKDVSLSIYLTNDVGISYGGCTVYDALEDQTFRGTNAHVSMDDVRQVLQEYFRRVYFRRVELEPDHDNPIVEGQLKAQCEQQLRDVIKEKAIPAIQAYNDKVKVEDRTPQFVKHGKIRSKFAPRAWGSQNECRYNTDQDGLLMDLEYSLMVPNQTKTSPTQSKMDIRYHQTTGLSIFCNGKEVQFSLGTFEFILDQLKNETFEY